MPSRKRKRPRSNAPITKKTILVPASEPSLQSPPLLGLPLEIRLSVYALLFQERDPIHNEHYASSLVLPNTCNGFQSRFAPILFVCRQIHSEAWPIYTQYRTFGFTEPLVLANNFLSFLPHQRLRCLRHLTLVGRKWTPKNLPLDFERVWWNYLDVFTRLDTLTLVTHPSWQTRGLHKMLPVIFGLLEMGATDRSKRISGKKINHVTNIPNDLPGSFDWCIQVASMEHGRFADSGLAFIDGWINQVVVRRGHGVRPHSELFKRGWMARQVGESPQKRPCKYRVRMRGGHIEVQTPNTPFFSTKVYELKVGPHTRLLDDIDGSEISPTDFRPVDVVNISGRWINNRQKQSVSQVPSLSFC